MEMANWDSNPSIMVPVAMPNLVADGEPKLLYNYVTYNARGSRNEFDLGFKWCGEI